MQYSEVIEKLNLKGRKNGRYVKFTKAKDCGQGVQKISELNIRLGVNYANMKINKDRETPIQSLPWGKWVPGYEGLLIEHTKVDKKTHEAITNHYLRVASAYDDSAKSYYIKDGKQITKDEAIAICGERQIVGSGKAPDVYNVNVDSIIKLEVKSEAKK